MALLKNITTNPRQSQLLLERLIRERQSGITGVQSPFRRDEVVRFLQEEGIYLAGALDLVKVREEFVRASAIGRNWPRAIHGVAISRPDIDELIASVHQQSRGSILLTDGPGTGKTCVLLGLVEAVEQDPAWNVLYIRGDEFAKCSSDRDFVEHGLPVDFVVKCAALAQERRVLVVVDSLDVLSLHGEHQSLRALLNVVDRLLRLSNVTCVLACRAFDLAYDPLLRDRKWDKKISLRPLDLKLDVLPLLNRLGIASSRISDGLATLLVVPENLRLFADLAVAADSDPARWNAIGDDVYRLHAHYLETVVRRDPALGDEALQALEALATQMVEQRALRVSRSAVGLNERTLRRLISQGLLLEAGGQTLRLGHQTLLDALVVRKALATSQSLVCFIRKHPPFPFLRPVVQAFVRHLRQLDDDAFGREVRKVFEAIDVAYHVKRAVLESLAEIRPGNRDWPLIRFIYVSHRDFFDRLLGGVQGPAWFHFLLEQWWPALPSSPDSDPSRVRFIAVLDRWMNDFPREALALWKDALTSAWGGRSNVVWSIQIQLKGFEHWDIEGVEELLRDLVQRAGEKDLLGASIGKFVDATGRGLDVLWQFITKDVDGGDSLLERALRCEDYHFHRNGFLADVLASSDDFLDAAIRNVEGWGDDSPGLDAGALHHTAWVDSRTEFDVRDVTGLRLLMNAIGEALRRRAKARDASWTRFEPILRRTRNLGLRYLLLDAYAEAVEANVDGIAAQILDEELAPCGHLDHELGELANKAYPVLSVATQDRHQEMLLRRHAEWVDRYGDDASTTRAAYDLLRRIPIVFRTPATQWFLDQWEHWFHVGLPLPNVSAWGGALRAPIDVAQCMRLAPSDLRRLLEHYENVGESWEWCETGLVGGLEQVCQVVASAASRRPLMYLELARECWRDGRCEECVDAVVEGASDHLRYRLGTLAPPNGWAADAPPPDSEVIVEKILWFLEKHGSLWGGERAMARALEGCADAVMTSENAERIAWLLVGLRKASEPEVGRVRFDPQKRAEPEAVDLMQDSMSAARGTAGNAVVTLASRLTELGLPFPDLLIPTLKAFASDPVASVRASVLRSTPYFLQKYPELGWDVIDRALERAPAQLWVIAGKAFSARLGRDFERISPYLEKMLEHAKVAGETWGGLAALSYLRGKMDLERIFVELERKDVSSLWAGVAKVLASNLDREDVASLCRAGLLRMLRRRPVPESIIGIVDRHLRGDGAVDMPDVVAAVLDAHDESSSRVKLIGVVTRVAVAVNRDPVGALPLLEKLIGGFEARPGEVVLPRATHFLQSEPLIAALVAVMREADQFGDEALVRRALSLQDACLRLNIPGIEEMLNAASLRS